jgi:Family of unknown function (DUF6194)
MTEDEVITFVSGLPGVEVLAPDESGDAPEIAWGDTFFYYGPARNLPFTTIVTKDYPGFDEASRVSRPGVFRVNIAVGKDVMRALFSTDAHDFAALDTVMPHPVYAAQGWVSVLNPESTSVESLIVGAHARAAAKRT